MFIYLSLELPLCIGTPKEIVDTNDKSISDRIEVTAQELSSIYSRNLLYAAVDNALITIDYFAAMKTDINYLIEYARGTIMMPVLQVP